MIEFMVDLETMGNGNTAAITAIGIVAFDSKRCEVISKEADGEFYQVVSLASSMEAGLQCDASTILWWLKQSDEAKREMYARATPLYDVLTQLTYWMSKHVQDRKQLRIWGNGASFDNVILANAFKAVGLEAPWSFWGDRCFRTMKNLFGHLVTPPDTVIAHHALEDAKWQAQYLCDMLWAVREEDQQ